MSSSAALCLATILALTVDEIDPREMVAIAREAEHRAGSPVGAMDQSASVAGNVIVFDGRDNSYEQITPDLGDLVFAVADSGVDRSLRTSSYGARVEEAEEAHWESVKESLSDLLSETLVKRVRHVVTETLRVREAEGAVRSGGWERFGTLMNESGDSSANDYEISHPTVEKLVATIRQQDGVLGARMMGGGEGGPALVLLRHDAVEAVSRALDATFYADHPVTNPEPFQVCSFGPGAHRESAFVSDG
jgi:galactokinase